MAKKRRSAAFWLRLILMLSGSFFLLMCLIAFTRLPFNAYYRLGTSEIGMKGRPSVVVLLSGAGMPSESSLIRAYYVSQLAVEHPASAVVIAMPGDASDPDSDPRRLADELILRGVGRDRIKYAASGSNTRGQAVEIAEKLIVNKNAPVTLVTSPEHMRRAVLAFRKCGFRQVSGQPTFEQSLPADQLRFNDSSLEGNALAPPIGHRLQARYQFWTHLGYEVLVMREYTALAYYKLRGWI